ncbi:TPA: phosphoribosyltransferase [Pseudomonas aeruginosa]|uniref:phosphoribosyltransferase family protein n=1 Tax=Pseudomonas aeruginosa TaxID=287 RepID=UPI0012DA6C45|nr:phosphoribosyltransferase family protein [Pseudomonas aeruginosa]MBG3936325.1 phosphoribosyltransferase [Pseudomonas aeruginosa]MUH88126.1 hypothetical protein [Pseudomonas aeruginosa]HCF3841121.1 phosphoribosyltransferase [Pseudomonas aeruginosa]
MEKKPHRQMNGELEVYSIFRRRKARGNDGDGNPFIYALKGLNRYSISKEELWRFRPNYRRILGDFMGREPHDRIVPMPSSKPIARYVARTAKRCQQESQLDVSLFRKRTMGEVLPEIEAKLGSGEIPEKFHRDTKQLLSVLSKSPASEFSMKHVPQTLRGFVSPLALNNDIDVTDAKILLVDDLLSSGTTLRTAHELLMSAGASSVSALCLLSRV